MKNNHIIKALTIGVIAFFIGAVVSPSSGIIFEDKPMVLTISGNTLYVGGDGPGNYSTIQEAINDAVDGDTVFVFDDSSPYYEFLVINKSISLIGENQYTTIILNETIYTVFIDTDGVIISGFTIQGDLNGILIRGDFNIITGNIILNNGRGIELYKSNSNTITGNKISSNSHGIILFGSSNNIFKGDIISNNNIGIWLSLYFTEDYSIFSKRNTILKNNFINNCRDGYFDNSFSNLWMQNYWNGPRFLPKLIFGKMFEFDIPWINIDWHPAKEPFDIENFDIFNRKV